jgi:hypothetical protein
VNRSGGEGAMKSQAEPTVVKFPDYRTFESSRILANDAMVALLIGSRVADATLAEASVQDAARFLPDIVTVEEVERLNRTVPDARGLLQASEILLAYMAIPFALAVYQSFAARAVLLLRDAGKDHTEDDPFVMSLHRIQEHLVEIGLNFENDSLALFHLSRRIRNRVVHYAGMPGSRLLGEYRNLSTTCRTRWEDLTGRPLSADPEGAGLILASGEMRAVLAITKGLARELCGNLVEAIGRATWADIAVRDYRSINPQRFGEKAQRPRRLRGFTRTLYGPLNLGDEELADAVDRLANAED